MYPTKPHLRLLVHKLNIFFNLIGETKIFVLELFDHSVGWSVGLKQVCVVINLYAT